MKAQIFSNKKFLGLKVLVLSLFLCNSFSFSQPNWSYTITEYNHTILIQDIIPILINGTPISSGDYIGVFFDSTNGTGCGGYFEWTGINNSITAWEVDVGGDGFILGETFKWKIWQASTNTEFQAIATFDLDTNAFPHSNLFARNGISALTSLIVGPAPTLFYINPTDITCYGDVDGSAEVVTIYGTPPYDYLWSNGATTSSINNLNSGWYYLTFTDSTGTFTDSVEIIEPNELQINISILDVSSPGGADGEINLQVTGGTPPCSYQWSNGATSSNLTSLYAGNYLFTVTDYNGCFLSNSASVNQPSSTITGQVYTSTKELVQSVVVILYISTNNSFNAIDYIFSTNGQYQFADIQYKDYLIQAIPNFSLYSYLPTYNGNILRWEQTTPISIEDSLEIVNITLPHATLATNGNGTISGTVFFDHDSLYEANIFDNNWFGRLTSKSSNSFTVRNIPVFLHDDLGNEILCTLTDINGNYQFTDLPYNLYYINVEKAGFVSENIEVIVNETNPEIGDISFTIIDNEIIENIGSSPSFEEMQFSIYPNPVNDFLNIDFTINENASIRISIYDCIGNVIASETSKKTKGEHFIKMNTEDLSNGIYFVKFEIDNLIFSLKKFVK
mgnify:FL=1